MRTELYNRELDMVIGGTSFKKKAVDKICDEIGKVTRLICRKNTDVEK